MPDLLLRVSPFREKTWKIFLTTAEGKKLDLNAHSV